MKKLFLLTILLSMTFIVKGQTLLSLDSCRALALANNKDLLISNEKINAAHYERKAAFTNYLPNFSATGTYMRNQKEFSLLNKDQKAALSGLGTNLAGPIQQAATQIATAHPELAPLISSLSGELGAVLPALDQVGNSLVDALFTINNILSITLRISICVRTSNQSHHIFFFKCFYIKHLCYLI